MLYTETFTAPTPKAPKPLKKSLRLYKPNPNTIPTHAEIALLAYNIFLKSGSIQGHCLENWLKAEKDLRLSARSL